MLKDNLGDKGDKLKGLMEGIKGQAENNEIIEDNPIDKTDIGVIFAPSNKEKIVNKGFTIREDQAKRIEKYSKRAKKKESEFMRDLLDYVFGIIENEE